MCYVTTYMSGDENLVLGKGNATDLAANTCLGNNLETITANGINGVYFIILGDNENLALVIPFVAHIPDLVKDRYDGSFLAFSFIKISPSSVFLLFQLDKGSILGSKKKSEGD